MLKEKNEKNISRKKVKERKSKQDRMDGNQLMQNRVAEESSK